MKCPKYGFDVVANKTIIRGGGGCDVFPSLQVVIAQKCGEDAWEILYSTRSALCRAECNFSSRKRRGKNLIIKICEGGRRFSTGISSTDWKITWNLTSPPRGCLRPVDHFSSYARIYVQVSLNPIFFLSATSRRAWQNQGARRAYENGNNFRALGPFLWILVQKIIPPACSQMYICRTLWLDNL